MIFSVRRFCFAVVYLFPVLFLHAQKPGIKATIDSLNRVSEHSRYSSTSLSASCARQALRFAAGDPALRNEKVTALINWSYALTEAGALDSAAIIADSANVNAVGITDAGIKSALLVLRGYLLDYNEQYEEALQYYFEGLALCPDSAKQAAICNNIGTVYKVMNDLDNAQKYYERSYTIGVQTGDLVRQAKCLNNLGGVFYSRNDYAGALSRYRQSMRIRESLADTVAIASSMSNIAMVYEKMGRLDSALLLYTQAMLIDSLTGRPAGLVVSYINIGNVLFSMNKPQAALARLQKAAALSDSLRFHYYSRLAHRSLANYYAKTGDYEHAYSNFVLYAAYNDSVLTEAAQRSRKELELRYQTRETANQIALMVEQQKTAQLEKEKTEAQLGRERFSFWLLTSGACIVVIVALLLFLRYRGEKKHAQVLSGLVSEKDMLLREIHHRVKNNLQLVSSLLSLQEAAGNTSGAEALRRSQERIHTLSLLHEQLYRSADLKAISFRGYMEKLLAHISSAFSSQHSSIRIDSSIEDRLLDIDQLVPCGLIVNELVTNCYKHAFPGGEGVITVRAEWTAEECVLSISDNGKGMESAATASSDSLGIRLIHGLARQLKATTEQQTAPGEGTHFRIRFPVRNLSPTQQS